MKFLFEYGPSDQIHTFFCLSIFSGWKNERVIREFDDGKIILVRPGDPKRHWTKAESVLDVR